MLPIMTETTTPERREILQRARAVRTLAKHRRWAEEMRAAGWSVSEPRTTRRGLCGDRRPHDPHAVLDGSLGPYVCTADQNEREPWRSERLRERSDGLG